MAVGADESWSGDRVLANVVWDALQPDDLRQVAGGGWMRIAEDRDEWRKLGEAYVQQWTAIG